MVKPLGSSMLWPSCSEAPWSTHSVTLSPGQQAAASTSLALAPAGSLVPGPVLPMSVPFDLSKLLGMAQNSSGASSGGLPVSLVLQPVVTAASGNVQDPLDSLSKMNAGIRNIVPTTNIGNSSVMTEARMLPDDTNGRHAAGLEVKEEPVYLQYTNRQANADGAELGNGPPGFVSELSKLPSGLGNVYTTVKSEQPSTVVPQLPLINGPPQSMLSSACYPALHQLLQSTESRSIPAPPAYSTVYEGTVPAGNNLPIATTELTTVPPFSRRRWTSADSAILNSRNGWGYPNNSADSTAGLPRQESSGFDISKNTSSAVDSQLLDPVQNASADSDMAEFSAPSGMGLHQRFKRSNRPRPLIIPSQVGHFGFQSRLRSPRVSDQVGPGLSTEMSLTAAHPILSSLPVESAAGITPYTPPPMLSPVRSGSGLFCSLVSPSPKSAPVGLRLGLLRCSKYSVLVGVHVFLCMFLQ